MLFATRENENTDGLLRQYFPKGTDLSRWSRDEIQAVAAALNARLPTTARLGLTRQNISRKKFSSLAAP